MKNLAMLAGVSRPAVSAVLNNTSSIRVSAKTRQKILNLAAKTNFVPNLAARQLKGHSSGLIGLISVPSYMGLVALLQAELITILQAQGMEVLTVHMHSDTERQKVLRDFRSRNVNGIIALSTITKIIQPDNAPIPLVYCSHTNQCGYDVGCDRHLGGYLAARHLLEHGRINPVFLGLDFGPSNRKKHEGMCRALKEAGLNPGKNHLLIAENGNFKEILAQLKKRRADALVCCNDFAAADMLKALLQSGIKVPDDIAMTGFDGYAFCNFTPVTLATVVQPIREEAQCAADLLMRRIKEKLTSEPFSNINLPPVFKPGGSCGCPEAARNVISGDALIHL
jgi:DNA-binding LacI/PurR family transcriptional regulator